MTRPRKHDYAGEPTPAARKAASRAAARAAGLRPVELMLPERALAQLDALATAQGMTRAEIVARLVDEATMRA